MSEDPSGNQPSEIDDLRKENAELQKSISEMKRDMTSRLVLAELKAEAVRAGIIDLDGLKLLDLEGAKIDDRQNVHGAPELIGKLKKEKPYLFQSSSSATNPTPPAQPATKKLAMEMTDEEYKSARAALLRHSR